MQATDIQAMNARKLESGTTIKGLGGLTVGDYWARAIRMSSAARTGVSSFYFNMVAIVF